MKKAFNAFAMTQSMFCAIPLPLCRIWDEEARPSMPVFLPIVGLELGVIWYGVYRLLTFTDWPPMMKGLILCIVPYIFTGFLHLDGFMDVTDAVRSCRSREKMQEILKDSRVGAFAVIGFGLLLLSGVILFSSVPQSADWRILIFIPIISRCAAALCVTLIHPIKCSNYAGGFWNKASKLHLSLIIFQMTAAIVLAVILCGKYSFCLLALLAGFLFALHRGVHALGGMNGDIAGYSITISELFAAAMLAIL